MREALQLDRRLGETLIIRRLIVFILFKFLLDWIRTRWKLMLRIRSGQHLLNGFDKDTFCTMLVYVLYWTMFFP